MIRILISALFFAVGGASAQAAAVLQDVIEAEVNVPAGTRLTDSNGVILWCIESGICERAGLRLKLVGTPGSQEIQKLLANDVAPGRGAALILSNQALAYMKKPDSSRCITAVVSTLNKYEAAFVGLPGVSWRKAAKIASSPTSYPQRGVSLLAKVAGEQTPPGIAGINQGRSGKRLMTMVRSLKQWLDGGRPKFHATVLYKTLYEVARVVHGKGNTHSGGFQVVSVDDMIVELGAKSGTFAQFGITQAPFYTTCQQLEERPEFYRRFTEAMLLAGRDLADPKNGKKVRVFLKKKLRLGKLLANLRKDNFTFVDPKTGVELDDKALAARILEITYKSVTENVVLSGKLSNAQVAHMLDIATLGDVAARKVLADKWHAADAFHFRYVPAK